MAAPYVEGSSCDSQERTGILLLFSDCLVILKKKMSSGFNGRDFLRELDKPSPAGLLVSMTNAAGGTGAWQFAFTGWHSLADIRFTDSADGRLVWMTSTQEIGKGAHTGEYFTSKAITSRCFILQEAYAGKAVRLGEETVKARIESRFPEAEREHPTWTLRSVKPQDSTLALHAAVFQEAAEQLIPGRREPAGIRVVLDNDKRHQGAPVGHYGVEIVVEVRTGDMKRLINEHRGPETGRSTLTRSLWRTLLPTLTRRGMIPVARNLMPPSA